VLDEPFSGLDPVAVDVMSEVLTEKCAVGAPVIFSSHQLDTVEKVLGRSVFDLPITACRASTAAANPATACTTSLELMSEP